MNLNEIVKQRCVLYLGLLNMSCRKINLSESQIQKIVLIVNLCMVITSIVLVSIQVFAWKNDLKHINTAADISNYGASCLPCEDIDSGYSVVRTADAHVSMKLTQQHDDRDILECCMDRKNMIEMLINKKILAKQEQGGLFAVKNMYGYRNDGSNITSVISPSPAAHLLLDTAPSHVNKTDSSNASVEILQWVHDKDNAYLAHGLQYHDGRLAVAIPGTYHVYCQVYFVYYPEGLGKNISEIATRVQHSLKRENNLASNGTFLKTVVQNSELKILRHNQAYHEWTSYISAMVNMEIGDRLFVEVSNISLIFPHPKLSYFGAHLI